MASRIIVNAGDRVGQPNIPACVILGDLILPSVISGRDPAAEEQSVDPETQIAQAFTNMRTIVEAAGGSLDGIGKVTVYLKDFGHRGIVNKYWQVMFPDPQSRPARHVLEIAMHGSDWIQLDVIASR
jgi:2-iminobutanoate/2-iminopropanoate deaminase